MIYNDLYHKIVNALFIKNVFKKFKSKENDEFHQQITMHLEQLEEQR